LRSVATTKNYIHEELKISKARGSILYFRAFISPSLLSETPKMMVIVEYGYLEGSAGENIDKSDAV